MRLELCPGYFHQACLTDHSWPEEANPSAIGEMIHNCVELGLATEQILR